MLRGIFGPKRKAVTGGWKRLHNKELPSPIMVIPIKKDERGRACMMCGRVKKCIQNFGQ
jgi:hypothetical protein